MVEFKKEGFYKIRVDTEKNRMYIEYYGFWQTPDDVPDFLEHCKKSIEAAKRGFDMVFLFNDDKPPKLGCQKMHKEAHKMWMAHGVKRGALIFKTGKVLQKFVVSVLTKLSGAASNAEIKVCNSEAEAEAWFDSTN